jgi:ketosteroid isomerase-like protein
MSDKHKALVREFYEAIDSGNQARMAELCTPTAMFQFGSRPANSFEEFTLRVADFARGTARHVVHDLIADGDKVACHVDVVAQTADGESVTKALTLFTVADGRIAGELAILDRPVTRTR